MVPSGTWLHYIQLAIHAASLETFVLHFICFNLPQIAPALKDCLLIVQLAVDIWLLEKKQYFLTTQHYSPCNSCSWNIVLDKNESENLSYIFWLGWDFWRVTFITSHYKLGKIATLLL